MDTAVVIGLSAVVVAIRDDDAVVLTVRPRAGLRGLPFGPFDPEGHRTFELALRAFVTEQTRFDLGYVEQLYTFGDKGRDAPIADMGDGPRTARVLSVGYLALTPAAVDTQAPDTEWSAWSRFFPWEDWRAGRPAALGALEPALQSWAAAAQGAEAARRASSIRLLFALDGAAWNEERVLERYELLYEAGLAPEAARDRGEGAPAYAAGLGAALGEPMISDHRRILATALSRLRGKLKYRPVAFELMTEAFTLSALQRAVEAIAGVPLHKQNFRRALERAGLVEGLGRLDSETGGRPAELFRFRRELLGARPVLGLALPQLRD
ncbi:MAG: NAD regulator [Phenylobacterium sp.]|uniref:NUDIX hydrolase n=1 Tax=Phenylobacterium sp. TaxID=1871053 RepID=UPI0027338EF7|nr:NAD regulator [Phenylobacterium sp.]MDP3176222.1 NAD regulator [Phenylobacterium sp.]